MSRKIGSYLVFKMAAKKLLIILFLILFSGISFSQEPTAQVKDEWRYEIDIKNNEGSLESKVAVRDLTSQQIVLKKDLSEIYVSHYHNSEYHDGKLYIVHRTGGDNGYETNKDWTDSLWCYTGEKQKTKIYSSRGLDFRASDDNSRIAIIPNEQEKLIILSGDGKILKEINSSDFGFEYVDFLSWGKNELWLKEGGPEAALSFLIKMDTNDYSFTKYDISEFGFFDEYSFNPANGGMLVFSDYPVFFDADEAAEFEKNKTKVMLQLYIVKTKEKKVLSVSKGKSFMPKWINNSTVSYNDETGKQKELDMSQYF